MGQKSQDSKPEKWNVDAMQTGIYDPSVVSDAPLPQVHDYFNPNSVTRYLKSPSGIYAVNPNVRVRPSSTSWQSEVIICRHPLNPLIMFGSSNAINNSGTLFISEGVYMTTNGGLNWFGTDTLQGSPISNHGGDPGPTIDKNGTLIMTHLGYSTSGMFANYSTNNGATWSSTYTIASGSQDKNFAGTDDAPSSPYYGRSYCVWSLFSAANPPIAVSYTTNGGVSWSAAAQINTSVAGHYSQGCDIRVGPNGEVYVIWAAPSSGSPYTEDFLGFGKSTNGGNAWTVTNNAYDMNGIRGTFASKSGIRVNGFPRIDVDRSGGSRNGWIYVVSAEINLSPAGSDPDIVIHKSTNGGTSWSSGVRVNQDALNNGKYQWFPAIRVDETGGVNVVYYDDRNTASDSAEIYISRSIDGGVTFNDQVVSDHRFKPKPITLSGIAGGYQGDYIGITSGNGKVWPIWMDDITGIYQAWTTSVDLGPSISHTPLPNTEQLSGSYAVNCQITAAGSGINPSKTRLLYSRNNPAITDSVLMTNSGGNNWTASIPATGSPATYRYYITATDSLNRRSTSPGGAPSNLNTFYSFTDNTKPVITHTPLSDVSKPSWPVSVNAVVTDNLGIDSSWVVWYKNSVINTKEFKLINSSGDNYSAAFNSLNSDVNIGDYIFYRIFAKDNSTAHNVDSTALYNFKITDLKLCEDFTVVTYPPTGWALEYTGTQYWTRQSVSAFGVGTGSAKFDFWSAFNGTVQSMVTFTFGNTIAGDSLKFDHAYAPYTSGTDSLEILTSTNGGTTYSSLVRLWGNASNGNLNTRGTLTSSFTPATNEWASNKIYALPVGTNKVKFRVNSGYGNNLFVDNICVVNRAAPVPATIKLAEEGFYNTSTGKLNIRDTVTVFLRGVSSPYPIVDSAKTVIDSVTLSGNVTFNSATTGSYYLMIRHRNALETWSKSGGESYTRGAAFSYDFTSAQSQAYGSNMILKGSKYCLYSGDINHDYIIDLTDIIAAFNDASAFVLGYVNTDLTGDGTVDISDIIIAFNNANTFVVRQAPPGAGPLIIKTGTEEAKKNINALRIDTKTDKSDIDKVENTKVEHEQKR